MSAMRRLFVLLLVPAVAAVFAIPAFAATKTVKVGDNYFVRDGSVPTVTVKKNATVRWAFAGDNPHNVKVKSGPVKFTSPTKSSGVFRKKMTRAGLYRIYCEIHGESDQSMKLRVKSK
jgi:plastocyanin